MARIIHVEADERVGAMVRRVLGEAGHMVEVIDHGILAFDTIAFRKPDLVILDHSLPGAQGLDILRALRRLPALGRTPILMLAARSGAGAEAMDAGASDHLVKPFTPELLARRVQAMLHGDVRA
ncbi:MULTISPECIES: PleD family two-component system response regulator [Sphingomonas]|jgi:two-component system response regulator MtrA|uniref:Two-component system response regulator MtrA n=1 Tax=Sphingomonas leidyi TaxID=68569 RepID=A0A7X5ZTM5_9SPHN|nr:MULTISPECIES: response regulator [Sphingomonas]NIJ63176.1 two-component system response regulator MtrA [Sphingomonas leidyi]OJY53818.1 MAG: hypothetical protein BGP17_07165 [Sphingomonas sp. 67-41]